MCSRDRGGTTVPRRAGQAFLGAAVSGPAMSRGNMGSSEHSPGHKRVTSRLLFPYSCSPLPWELCPTSCSSKKKGTAMGRCCQHPHPPQHKRQPAELRSWKQHLKELRGKTALTATRPGWGANVRAGSLRTGLTAQRSHPWEWRRCERDRAELRGQSSTFKLAHGTRTTCRDVPAPRGGCLRGRTEPQHTFSTVEKISCRQ